MENNMTDRKLQFRLLVVLCFAGVALGQAKAAEEAKNPGDALNRDLSLVERDFVSAADAMPEEKYSFAPTNGQFKGVRTFAQQVKHVASANYFFGSSLLGEKPPVDTGGENGPDALKSKAEIVRFLRDSFAYLHKALGSVSQKNELEMVDTGEGKSPRLSLAAFSVAHPMDHYGQMVEYLRMNGIIPPASRRQSQ
jgi:uncharacterized damage-inducible protein DinB